MTPEAEKELGEYLDKLEKSGAPKECWPRLFFMGHRILHDLPAKEGLWVSSAGEEFPYCSRECRWQCNFCKHEWEGEEGNICPSCKAGLNL